MNSHRRSSSSFCLFYKKHLSLPEVPTGEQQGQTERDEVITVAGRPEGLPAQGLREGAQTLDR